MRVNKKEINNIMNILDLNLRRANNTLDNIVAIVNKYIPSIISIDKDKYCINVKTDLIYDIHKSYFKDIRDIGIDINKVIKHTKQLVMHNNGTVFAASHYFFITSNMLYILIIDFLKLSFSCSKRVFSIWYIMIATGVHYSHCITQNYIFHQK